MDLLAGAGGVSASFEASGFRELDRKLAALAQALPEQKQREILHQAAEPIVAEAKRLAPVDTGRLQASIKSEDDRDASIYGKLNAAGMATPRGGVSIYIGPVGSTEDGDVFYARFQEFGTIEQKGTPFMRPAFQSKRGSAEERMLAQYRTVIAQAIR